MGGKEIIMGWLKNLFTGNEEEQKEIAREKALEERKKDRAGTATERNQGDLGTILSYIGKELISNKIDDSLGGIIHNTITGAKQIKPVENEEEKANETITIPQTLGTKITNGINEIVNNSKENINNLKEELESAINKTPSDSTINEYKDDTNKMILEFLQEQEQTRQKELKDAYAREDEIRKETQEREDSAYQRAVADMRKAGINPNLVGISPSASGGGISSASRSEQILGSEIQSYTTILNALIEKDTTMTEGDKNRLTQLISAASNLFLFSKLRG